MKVDITNGGTIEIESVAEACELESALNASIHAGNGESLNTYFMDWWLEADVAMGADALFAFTRRLGLALTQFWRKRAESGTTDTDAA